MWFSRSTKAKRLDQKCLLESRSTLAFVPKTSEQFRPAA